MIDDQDLLVLPERPIQFIDEIDKEIIGNNKWIMEPKLDGWRALLVKNNEEVKLYSRNLKLIKTVIDCQYLKQLPDKTVLDGELIAHSIGESTSYLVHKNLGNPDALYYAVFDIIMVDGKSLMDRPLIDRMGEMLELMTKYQIYKSDKIRQIPKYATEINTVNYLLDQFEGVVFKKLGDPYEPDGNHWIKLKHKISA